VEALILNQISERQTTDSSIPNAGREIPESEQVSTTTNEEQSDQSLDDQQLMCLEVALARALQQLTSKSEN
jgi:hypothetical protein